MTERRAHGSRDERLESILSDVLGTTTLTAAQRQRLQAHAIHARRPQAMSRWALRRPVLRPLAALVVLALVLFAVWWADVLRTDAPADVSAAARLLARPQSGSGRHVVADVYRRYSRDGGERRWSSELWERTLPDGTRQIAIQAHDEAGGRLGSYIQSGEQWFLDYRGSTQSGNGEPGWLPEELTPIPYSIEAVDASLASYNREEIDIHTDGNLQTIRVDLGNGSDIGLTQVVDDLGEQLGSLAWEIEIDTEGERVLDTRVIATGISGTELVVSGFVMSSWDELPSSDLDAARFMPPEDDVNAGLEIRIPEAGMLPSNLHVISHYREDPSPGGPFLERAIFAGDGGVTVDLTITQKVAGSERTVQCPEGTTIHTIESSLGPVEWAERGDGGWVEQAIWEDQAHFYYLLVQQRDAMVAGWSVDELVAFVEELAAAQVLD